MTIRRVPEDFVVEEVIAPAVRAGWASARAGAAAGHVHAVFELTKTSLTTVDAVAQLAKTLGVRAGAIDYAGLKDKHARTVQHVSVKVDGRAAVRLESAEAASFSGNGWSARLVGWSERPVTAEAIEANRFAIVVRDLARAACEEMDRRAGRLVEIRNQSAATAPLDQTTPRGRDARPPTPSMGQSDHSAGDRLVFINYFGDQRFGSARHGRGFIARHLIAGEFEEALRLAIATPARKDAPRVKRVRRLLAEKWGKWEEILGESDRGGGPDRGAGADGGAGPDRGAGLERGAERRVVEELVKTGDYRAAFAALPYFQQQIAVEAYQSYLWNATARRLAEEMAGGKERLVRADDAFGEMVFPEARAVGPAWREVAVPMLAAGTVMTGVWARAAGEVLRGEGITVEQLRIPGLRRPAFGEAMRPLVAEARGFEMGGAEADEMSAGGKRFKRAVRFELPRGAYATVVLRGLGE